SLVRSAAVRSGAATIALICSDGIVCAWAGLRAASARRSVSLSLMGASRETGECPAGGVAHQRRFVVQQQLNSRQRLGRAAVAECIGDIAHESVAADALDGGTGEAAAEGRVVQRGEFDQRGRAEVGARGKGRVVRLAGKLVPRAGCQTIVAAV